MNRADREFAERLVLEVKKRPIIYATNHPEHRDRFKVDMEWTSVAAKMNSTARAVKRRWQNLRGSFSKCLSAKNHQSGSGAKNNSTFYLFEEMSFLQKYMQAPLQIPQESHMVWLEDSSNQDDEPPASSSPTPSNLSATISASSSAFRPVTTPREQAQRKRQREEAQDWEESAGAFFMNQQSDCPELDYFKGLVPMIKELKKRRKCVFYAEVTNLLVKHLEEQDEGEDMKGNITFE